MSDNDFFPRLNENAVIMECKCGYKTDVYSVADIDMWDTYKTGYPACPIPTCKRILKRAKKQYAELS